MNRQIFNPIFAENEYVPDGEPHIFGDSLHLNGDTLFMKMSKIIIWRESNDCCKLHVKTGEQECLDLMNCVLQKTHVFASFPMWFSLQLKID